MAKFKVGDKVRYIDGDWFEEGEILYVLACGEGVNMPYSLGRKPNDRPSDLTSFWVDEGEFELVEEPSANLTEEIYVLKRKVAELEGRLTELEPDSPKITLSVPKVDLAKMFPKKSANELRKEAIEKAKKFVKETEGDAKGSRIQQDGNHLFRNVVTFPEFVINEDKRTVVTLVKDRFGGVHEKGIAKCAPSDVFNVHIGKAIALGRAYGLPTSEFEQAPQPDEVVPGMEVIRFNKHGDYLGDERVDSVKVLTERGSEYAPESTHVINGCMLYGGYGDRIISDSEAQY